MNRTDFTHLLEHPNAITANHIRDIRVLIDEYPYFQSAQALYLKGLKEQKNFTYNKALKVTAAHTTDRNVLFDYISSPLFSQNDISTQIEHQEQTDTEDASIKEKLQKAEEETSTTSQALEEILEVGKPLDFNTAETHSFTEWLKLATFKPIQREESTVAENTKEADTKEDGMLSRKHKEDIINSFIKSNPKIKIASPKNQAITSLDKIKSIPPDALMTETLARVYLEQKKYKKARLAYRILSLKYPEKSGFFADQIRAIQELEKNKE